MNRKNSELLLTAALKVFASRGYHGASISEIAKQAGVSKALFYHYFKSKEDLLVIFAKQRLEEWGPLIEGLERIDSPFERIEFLVDFVLHELEENTERLRFINSLYLNKEGVGAIEKAMRDYKDLFDRIFIAERKLFEDLGFSNPELEATFFRSILQGISLEYMLGPKDYPLQIIKEKLLARYSKGGKGYESEVLSRT